MAKREVKDVDTSRAGFLLTLTFANGESRNVDCGALNDAVKEAALVWGIREKLTNATALSRDEKTGKAPPLSDKIAAVDRVLTQIIGEHGVWSQRGEGDGMGGALLLQALYRAYPAKSREAVAALYAKWTKEQRRAMAANPKVAPHIAAIQAERTSDVDTEQMLDAVDELE